MKKDISHNSQTEPIKQYLREIFWCEKDDVWVNIEIPSKDNELASID